MNLPYSVHSLIINIAIYLFIFIIPYQALSLKATGFEVGLLMTLHSIGYIVSTWLNSSHFFKADSKKMMKLSYLLLTATYCIGGFSPHLITLWLLVCASGILLGIYWPHFWKIHSENSSGESGVELCNSFALMTIGVLVGPALAGFSYQYLGTGSFYIAAILAFFLFVVTPIRESTCQSHQELNSDQTGEISLWRGLFFHYRKLLLILVWLDITLIGYLEGNFRAAGPLFMLKNGYSSQFWGLFLALKLLIQILVILGLKRIGPAKIIGRKSHWWFFVMELTIVLGAIFFIQSKNYLELSMAMVLFGLAIGFIYYTGIYFSLLGSEEHGGGKNLSGLAESVLGIGILSGSLIGGSLTGLTVRAPFFFLLALVALTIPGKYFFLFRKRLKTNQA